MAEEERGKFVEHRRDQEQQDLIDQEIKDSFAEDQELGYGSEQLKRELRNTSADSPELTAGDVDAAWDRAAHVGEEAVGGTTPTPDQDVVDELGRAVGLTYSDTEPLHTDDKLNRREQNRWELDPASDPEYSERIKQEFRPPPPARKKTARRGKKRAR